MIVSIIAKPKVEQPKSSRRRFLHTTVVASVAVLATEASVHAAQSGVIVVFAPQDIAQRAQQVLGGSLQLVDAATWSSGRVGLPAVGVLGISAGIPQAIDFAAVTNSVQRSVLIETAASSKQAQKYVNSLQTSQSSRYATLWLSSIHQREEQVWMRVASFLKFAMKSGSNLTELLKRRAAVNQKRAR